MRTVIAGCIAILALATVAVGEVTVPSPTSADAAAIKQTALDYVEGWYEADAQRMSRALAPKSMAGGKL
jgi:hypothetical protein